MRLHLPYQLRLALIAAVGSFAGFTTAYGQDATTPDGISISFGDTSVSSTASGTLGGVGASGWNNLGVPNDTFNNLIDNSGSVTNAIVTVSSPAGSWGPGETDLTTVEGCVAATYLDIYNYRDDRWDIDIKTDYLISDLKLYFSGDNDYSISAININGTDYMGGATANNVGSETWGSRTPATSFNDNNTLTLNNVYGGSVHMRNLVDRNNRATLAGLQVTNTTADYLWVSSESGTLDGSAITYTKGTDNSTLAQLDVSNRILGFSGETTVNFDAGTQLNAIQASSGNVTITGSDLTIATLFAKENATITLNGALIAENDLVVGGLGSVILGHDQTLGDLTVGGNLHVSDNVTIEVMGDCILNGTVTGGDGAAIFCNVAADTAHTFNDITVTSSASYRQNLIGSAADGYQMRIDGDTAIDVESSGNKLNISTGSDTPVTVTLNSLDLTTGTTLLEAGANVSVTGNIGAADYHDRSLSVGKNVHLTYSGLVMRTSTLTIEGGTVKAESLMLGNSSRASSVININDGLLEVTGSSAATYKAGNIRLAHWGVDTYLNIDGGEFRALDAEVSMGDDGRAHISITEGAMNVAGIRTKNGSSLNMTGGELNIGSGGIFINAGLYGDMETQGSLSFTGGKLGVLEEGGWGTTLNLTLDGVTINTDVYDAANGVQTTQGANIALTGNLAGVENNKGNILTGSGSLTIAQTMGSGISLEDGSTATLILSDGALDNLEKTLIGATFTDKSGISENGYCTFNHKVMNTETNIAKLSYGDEELELVSSDGIAYVRGTEVSDGVYMINSGVVVYGDDSTYADSADTTGIVINDGSLTLQTSLKDTLTDGIELKKTATITLNGTDVTLNSSSVRVDSGAYLYVAGDGTYVRTGADGIVAYTDAATWSGTYVMSGTTLGNISLDWFGNANSKIVFENSSGYLNQANQTAQTYAANIEFRKDAAGNAAWTNNNGWDGDNRTFSGTISGDGDFVRNNVGSAQTFNFTGDVTEWKGSFNHKGTSSRHVTYLNFSGKATEINVNLKAEEANASVMNVGVENANAVAVNGNITGNISMRYSGLGDKTVSGDNNYTGGTSVDGGKLIVTSATGLGAGNVTVHSGLVFNSGDAVEFSHAISGSGFLEQSGEGTLTLSGTNSFTGGTFVTGGTLVAANADALGTTGSIRVENGMLKATTTMNLGDRVSLVSDGVTPLIGVAEGETLTLSGLTLKLDFDYMTEPVQLFSTESSNLVTVNLLDVSEGGTLEGDWVNNLTLYNQDDRLLTNWTANFDEVDGTISFAGLIVPEPSTASLSLLGLSALLMRRRRRNA